MRGQGGCRVEPGPRISMAVNELASGAVPDRRGSLTLEQAISEETTRDTENGKLFR